MYQRILCAIELSDDAKSVIGKAKIMAEKFGAQLFVINVLPYEILPKDYQSELENKAIPAFNELMFTHAIDEKHRILKVGKPYEVICDHAERKNIDLIIIGTHSKKGLKALLGSTATAVSNYAKCDVNLVRV